jgi:ABC-type amino acid transport substrate-binding protein
MAACVRVWALCLALVPGLAAAETKLTYAFPDQSVWTTRVDAQGVPLNPLLPFAKALFAKAGVAWQAKPVPSARMFEYLRDGTAQFSILVEAPTLRECCLLSRKPVATTQLHVYRLADRPAVARREDLAGKRVITIRGYSYAGLAAYLADPANHAVNEVAATHEAAFAMLRNRRADYLVDYAGPAAEVLAATPPADIRADVLSRLDVHLVLARSVPDAPAMMSRLEAIAETMDVNLGP